MLKLYVKTRDLLGGLRTDKGGVVSLEYVIVAACIVATVVLAFGTTATGPLGKAITGAITAIATTVATTAG
jgi:pilus assembly protein Flp/PilA